ncbi:FecR family protein [Hymenobacter bucti]|uniref:FecR family protein n=1 Tax=Hymenobacter bucti TaxID=1844114 RepID=A0ABW4QSF2_9BACT
MKYSHYSTEDFLADESFQAYALGSDPAAAQFWPQWLAQHPAQAADFQEAAALLEQLAGQRLPVSAQLQKDEAAKLRQRIREMAGARSQPVLRSGRRAQRVPYGWVAALLLVVGLLVAGLGLWRRPATATYTHYTAPAGAPRPVVLPDGSRVVLQANAKLTLATTWQPGRAREVWLQGDAYFDVAHTAPTALKAVALAPGNVKFTVHAGPLDIAVLGTQFTVFNHNTRPEVVLNSGQIALTAGRGPQKPLLLKPGELAVYNAATPAAPLSKRPVQAALYSAWTSGQLDFTDTPVPEIIAALQDTYGIQISVHNPGLLRQKLTGSLPGNDLEGMLAALGKSLDVNVHRAGKQVSLD